MLKTERQQAILKLCEDFDVVTVKFIQDQLGVSDMTVRRDLEELAKLGKLQRVHGGAKRIDAISNDDQDSGALPKIELPLDEKIKFKVTEKKKIVSRTLALIEPGDTIFLGSGTTIQWLAKEVQNMHLRVVTNSLPIINLLAGKDNLDLYMVGGNFRKETAAFVGSIAAETISKLNIEKAFMSANGVNGEHAYTFNVEEGKIQQLVLDKAHKKYLLLDSSKFDHNDFYDFYNLNEVNGIVTDNGVTAEQVQNYQKYTEVIVPSEEAKS